MELFDSHAHYNDEKFDLDREKIIKTAYAQGIKKIVNAGYSLESSKQAIKIAENYEFMYATVGISPNDIQNFKKEYINELENQGILEYGRTNNADGSVTIPEVLVPFMGGQTILKAK